MHDLRKNNCFVLIQLPPWGVQTPPIGVAYLSSYMRIKGYTSIVYDLNIELFQTRKAEDLWDFERKDVWSDRSYLPHIINVFNERITEVIHAVIQKKPLLVGLSVNQNSILFALEFTHRLKKELPDIFVLAGGWACFNENERALLFKDRLINACVVGEGEEALFEVVECYQDSGASALVEVPGVIINDEKTVKKSPRKRIADLDSIPFPTYEEFDLNLYGNGSPVIGLITSRGCLGNCVFCNDRIYQGRLRLRSPQAIVKEISYHIHNNNAHHFAFNDLVINGDLGHLHTLCDMIISEGLDCLWNAQFVVRDDIDLELLSVMKKAGCYALQLGIESGSNDILKKMRKNFTVKNSEAILTALHSVGIETWINLIVGFPGETEFNFTETVHFVEKNKKYINRVMVVNTCNVVFGSELMNRIEEYGIMLSDNPELIEVSWRGHDGNCDALRKERLMRLLNAINAVGIPIGQSNIQIKPSL